MLTFTGFWSVRDSYAYRIRLKYRIPGARVEYDKLAFDCIDAIDPVSLELFSVEVNGAVGNFTIDDVAREQRSNHVTIDGEIVCLHCYILPGLIAEKEHDLRPIEVVVGFHAAYNDL